MSFGSGSFGGFGQNNQQQQQPQQQPQQGAGFGGFGSNNSNTGGFGSSGGSGFGAGNAPSGGLFGASNTAGNTGSSFGGSGGFGSSNTNTANNQSPFGAAKPFGSTNTSGSGLFGGTTASSGTTGGFGGFGSGGNNTNNTNNANTSSPFGGGNTGGSLFGSSQPAKPAFGGGTGGSLFGGTSSGGFGASNTGTSGFGAPPSTALGGGTPQSDGTASVPFQAHTEKESASAGSQTNHFQSINFMQPYSKFSFEELRLADYDRGRRYGNGSNQAGAFGTSTGFGGSFTGSNNNNNNNNNNNTTSSSGFGQTNTGGLFGGNNPSNPSAGFGQGTASTPFGGTSNASSGGLFGTKPTTGGLFGGQPNNQTGQAGSLFSQGNNSNTPGTGFAGGGSGFGSNPSTGGAGGLFSQGNDQNKPGFSFGAANQQTTGFGATSQSAPFGAATNTSGGGSLFGGAGNTSSAFGGGQQQPQQQQQQQQPQQGGGNIFGGLGQQNQTQNQNPNQGAAPSGFGGFGGTDQNKQGGNLFGGANTNNTSGGLFGSNPQSSNAFGGNPGQSSGSSLFGPKPFGTSGTGTNTGGGLFGPNNQSSAPSAGGLFGNPATNNQAPSANTGGLFGGNPQQQQQQQRPSLFGGSQPPNSTGGGLFSGLGGSANNQSTGGSLFGPSNNQTQNQQPNNGYMSSNPQQSLQGQQSQGLSTSIVDLDPFGSSGLLYGLNNANAQSVGPLATPLSSSQKMKKSALLPHYKLNPNSASRIVTPQKRGYGFTYSTYGTPGSISSTTSTPLGFSSSFLGSSAGRGLGKSLSTSNLRRNFDSDDSVLSPNAFSASSNRYVGAGSLKKLNINRGIRGDLFSPPRDSARALTAPPATGNESSQAGSLKKRVSFDTSTLAGSRGGSVDDSGLSNGQGPTPSAEEQGFLRSSTITNGAKKSSLTNGADKPEMQQVKGNELAIVPEDESPPQVTHVPSKSPQNHEDKPMGEYWMKPTKAELDEMPREQKKALAGFTVGRHGCGSVTFDVPVDLTTVNVDRILDDIVRIITRSCSVYEFCEKPPVGKGLNVPSTIRLGNSWPRRRGGRKHIYETNGMQFNKHMDRLKSVPGTKFQNYDMQTGTWIFTVPHFTRYGIDYEDSDDEEDFTQSTLSAPPDTPTPKSASQKAPVTQSSGPRAESPQDVSMMTIVSSEGTASTPDDTFDFKRRNAPPGTFDDDGTYDKQEMDDEGDDDSQSFLDDGSVGSRSDDSTEEPEDVTDNDFSNAESESLIVEDQETAESFNRNENTTGLFDQRHPHLAQGQANDALALSFLGSIQQTGNFNPGTPNKLQANLSDDWAEQLQRTISPRKQDRQALRESQAFVLQDKEDAKDDTPRAKSTKKADEHGFNTSIDLMNSLFDRNYGARTAKGGARGNGFEWPYAKRSKSSEFDESSMDANEQLFHKCNKPSWGSDGTLVYAVPYRMNPLSQDGGILVQQKHPIVTEGNDVRFAKLASRDTSFKTLEHLKGFTELGLRHEVPWAKIRSDVNFSQLAELIEARDPHSAHEKLIWQLADILFTQDLPDVPAASDDASYEYLVTRVRKEKLSGFWAQLIDSTALRQVHQASCKEEAAIAYLSANRVEDACLSLVDGRDFRLSTLVSMIGGDQLMRQDLRDQLGQWRDLKMLSELSEPIRALYELLTGNTCVCEGVKGALEDRARTFVISERFGLDWRQSFGLRLWYGIYEEQSAHEAVQQFFESLEVSKEETARPVPFYLEEKMQVMWEDTNQDTREDLMWGLLKVYADHEDGKHRSSLEEVLMPQNYEVSPLEFRLAWQLYQALSARAPADETQHGQSFDRIANLTLDYSAQLEGSGEWIWALFVDMHLDDADQRAAAIKGLLTRHAGSIGDGPADQSFNTLTQEYSVPEQWIWEAKAVFARSVAQDHVAETEYLLKGGNWEEAHRTLCRSVAPQAVIADETETLEHLLSSFENVDLVPGWGLGGQVYLDYIHLSQLLRHQSTRPHDTDARTEKTQKGLPRDNKLPDLVKRLTASLPSVGGGGAPSSDKSDFYERIAVREMGAAVGRAVLSNRQELDKVVEKAKILSLPLTEDRYLRTTVDLSLSYYQAVIAAGGGGGGGGGVR
ncbi:MAG: Calcium-binding component of the spindle pole body (SPB) half-bridge [Chaenotheca gracillima]|nr:MAG: Calcium-binding component of the spindle pole body (SPB) half-bridge [Chaenotheca gracillima]